MLQMSRVLHLQQRPEYKIYQCNWMLVNSLLEVLVIFGAYWQILWTVFTFFLQIDTRIAPLRGTFCNSLKQNFCLMRTFVFNDSSWKVLWQHDYRITFKSTSVGINSNFYCEKRNWKLKTIFFLSSI